MTVYVTVFAFKCQHCPRANVQKKLFRAESPQEAKFQLWATDITCKLQRSVHFDALDVLVASEPEAAEGPIEPRPGSA
jgi:hypothetical protein